MNKSMLVGTVLGAVAVTAGGAVAGYKLLDQADKKPYRADNCWSPCTRVRCGV